MKVKKFIIIVYVIFIMIASGIVLEGHSYNNTIKYFPQSSIGGTPVNVSESGLVGSYTWKFEINNTTQTLIDTSYVIFDLEPSLCYSFKVFNVSGYTVSYPLHFIVGTTSITVMSVFRPIAATNVKFAEFGLNNITWYIHVGNQGVINNYSSTTSDIYLTLINGTYNLSVNNISGYTVSYPSTFTVNGFTIVDIYFNPFTYNTIISESGLPSNKTWSIELNNVNYTTNSSEFIFNESNGTYTLNVYNVNGYKANFPSSFTINGKAIRVNITFTNINTLYSLIIAESGLAANLLWSFSLNGVNYSTTATEYNFNEPDGTYVLFVYNISGYTDTYSSTIVINGGNVFVVIHYSLLKYSLTFIESGLRIPTWSFFMDGNNYSLVNITSYSFSFPDGNYTLKVYDVAGYNAEYNHTIIVNGSGFNVYIKFILIVYKVVITEKGLPSGTNWLINFNNYFNYLNTNYYNYYEPNGTYNLKVNDIKGYVINYSHSITVNGKNVYANITFTIIYYKVIFKMYGLPANTSWSILINNTNYITNATSLIIYLASNNYTPLIIVPSGYSVNDVGTLVVNGNTYYDIQASSSSLNFLTQNLAYIIVFIILMMVLIMALIFRNRRE